MQRYHINSCSSAVSSSALSGIRTRDTSRADSSDVQADFSLNLRKSAQLTPFNLRCDKEQLNSRLGPPDLHLPTIDCHEETLTREYALSGYRETVEGLEEARETSLSQVQAFSKPIIIKCKEAIRKCHRAINESRVRKRKAGQIYGVPLSGTLLTKSGIFPDKQPCGEDFRKKWIEGLSQPHKRLRSLADHVPHGYRRRSLLEVLIGNDVPLLRATWFIKVTYLNQVRSTISNSSSGLHDKTQFSRSEQWTKDVIEYLQHLLDEFITRNNSHLTCHMRDRSSQMIYAGSVQPKSDLVSGFVDGEEPSLYTKWWYMVKLIQWHHAEGLVVPSLIIDWVLNQLQEKDLLGVLQLLLPIIYGVIDAVVLCQTYVRTLVGIAVRFIQEPSPCGSDLVDNSRHAYTTSAVVEMLRYLILAVPDTFVALDCFPLPKCVISQVVNDGSFPAKMAEDARKVKGSQMEPVGALRDKNHDTQAESGCFHSIVSSIQNRAETLSRAARPNHPGHNVAKALQVLDQSLMHGELGVAYKLVNDDMWDATCAERWIAEVSSCLYMSLKHIGTVTPSVLCAIFFICEWATCEFRDFRSMAPHGLKFSGKKDFSQIFIAIRLLKLKMSNMPKFYSSNQNGKSISDIFESPGPLHDVVVCWIDQHKVYNGEGFKRLQLLVRELIRSGIFNPHAYVRQLIVSGIMDGNGPATDMERRNRHCKLLKQLPAPYICDALQDSQIAEPLILMEAASIYMSERRLVLHGLCKASSGVNSSIKKQKLQNSSRSGIASLSSVKLCYSRATSNLSKADMDTDIKLDEIKASISVLLKLPISSSSSELGFDESLGLINNPSGIHNRKDIGEETSGCEECKRVKRQKLSEERSSLLQSDPADEEETWWVGKGLKYIESSKAEQPPKPAKQASRGRQKSVRKTQSLAQLAAARIEGSQGASMSHVCESRIGCQHHMTSSDDVVKTLNGIGKSPSHDITTIGKLLKQMKFVEKRTVSVWLVSIVKQAIEEAEKTTAKAGQYGRPYAAAEDRNFSRWRLGEDLLSSILYMMDVCNELISATWFLLWLLPRVPSSIGPAIHSRNGMVPRIAENHTCEVGEAFLVSCISRYENLMVAADLIPEILSATMHRTAAVLASNGRFSGSPAFVYARHLLKKYGHVARVIEWEKAFKSTCDKRLRSELESGRSLDGDFGFSLGVPNGVEDLDDYFRQKMSGVRVSRVGLSMKDIVQRYAEEAFQFSYNKDRKSSGTNKSPGLDKLDDSYQIAHQIVKGLMDCMRHTGGAAQEGDPSLVSSAVAAIVHNVGQVIARIPDLIASSNHLNAPTPSGLLQLAQRILRIHITCLCILKEALGERQSRVFELALAMEASAALTQAHAHGKAPRGQFQMFPESHDFNSSSQYEMSNHSNKAVLGRASRITAAVSALVVGTILQGVISLERMVILFRLKEGMDLINFARSLKSNVNGNERSLGVLKVDNLIEVSVNWFRVLVGNCRTVADGFIVELLGEDSIVALSRMQRMLTVNLVLPPAYSVFAFVMWRPILDASFGVREDFHQLYQLLAVTVDDAIRHLPFREICLRDTRSFYDIIAADTLDSEFVSMLESNVADFSLKAVGLVPHRPRFFLAALIDCKMPPLIKLDERKRVPGQGELKKQCEQNVKELVGKLVNVLDTLQLARFHWQWVELRLLLNEQAINEKMMENDVSLAEAIGSLSPNPGRSTASENESNFIQLILTRLLVRPDAAPLFSEVVHLLGKSLEDSMLSQAKWLLRGAEVLHGKKSIRQKVNSIASEHKELSMKGQNWKPWGWCHSDSNKGEKWKSKAGALEEGEVFDEVSEINRFGEGPGVLDVEGFIVSQQHVTERALIKLILPCVDQGSDDLCKNFASEMIKQMSNIEQHISVVTRGVGKPAVVQMPATGSLPSKSSNRKSGKSGSPGISRQSAGPADTVPPSPAALRASMTLRLQFLLRLLHIICSDRELSGRNMRYTLASVILRLLGSRVVHEEAGHFANPAFISSKRVVESLAESSTADALLCGENLFDSLLLVFHVLLSSYQPSWLKLKSDSNSSGCSKDYAVFDREVAEGLQNELDCMELPETIRWRIQAAMPNSSQSVRCAVSCHPPAVSATALSCLQPSNPITMLNSSNYLNQPPRTPFTGRAASNSKTKPPQTLPHRGPEIDRWTLLEDGGSDHANSKASNWLEGAVRLRRTDLMYIRTIHEDS